MFSCPIFLHKSPVDIFSFLAMYPIIFFTTLSSTSSSGEKTLSLSIPEFVNASSTTLSPRSFLHVLIHVDTTVPFISSIHLQTIL